MDTVMFAAFADEFTKIATVGGTVLKYKVPLAAVAAGSYLGYKGRGAHERAKRLHAINQQMDMAVR